MMILRDPEVTKIVLVTLAETTPISEAAALQEDLRRADIEPYGWVVNSALCATETTDPILQRRVAEELKQVNRIKDGLAKRMVVVPYALEAPSTPALLLRQVWNGPRPATAPSFSTAELMETYITSHPVMVFTLANCPYCVNCLKVLDSVGARYRILEISNRPDKDAIKDWMLAKTGKKSCPRVFVGGNCIGGASDTEEAAATPALRTLIEKAGGLRMSGKEFGEAAVSKYPAVVFTLRNCSYCTNAMKALDSVGIKYEAILLSDRPDKEEVRDWFKEVSGKRSIPRVFVGGKCIGGGSDAEEMAASGELRTLAEAAGALKLK